MKKSVKRILAICFALVMTAMLTIGSMSFAVTTDGTVTVSKKLSIAQGVTAPEDFNFTVTKVSLDDVTTDAAKAEMPNIDPATAATNGMTDTDKDGFIIKNTTLDFSNTNKTRYPHAGVYIYNVTEQTPEKKTDGMTYDSQTYTVSVYVKANGDTTVVVTKGTDGKGDKVDPTPGTKTDDKDTDDMPSGVIFNNSYTTTPKDDQHDNASAIITKTVTGEYGDTTKQFSFNTKIKLPDTNKTATVTYQKVSGTTKTPVAVSADGSVSYTLANGEYLEIIGAPAGTTYTTTEDLAADAAAQKYTATVDVKSNGTDLGSTTGTQGTATTATDALIAQKTENSVNYTNENTKDDHNTPTGVLINNLPYIILAVVAVGGITAYVVLKKRHQADEA